MHKKVQIIAAKVQKQLHKETKIGQIRQRGTERKPNKEHRSCMGGEVVQSIIKISAPIMLISNSNCDLPSAVICLKRAKSTGLNIDHLPSYHQ